MKPLKLSLQAFGPFAGRETVDFTLLPPGCLFLIAGPTGAGKTSILDGITYALYGDTSGGERSAREMRSHHADASVQTEVEFEFALGQRHYRVRRVPEQERAALRGDKLVKVLARAELYRLEADGETWTPLAQKTTEVGALVEELLGFKAEQFRQVVVLPQGQFRKLLAASSAEREKILETLFATATYKRLQDALKADAAALRERGEKAALQRRTLLDQAGADAPEALLARRDALQAELAVLTGAETQARADDAAARTALQQGQAAQAQFVEADAAKTALQALETGLVELDTQRQRLAQARRAALVVPADSALAAARRSADEARTRAAQAAADTAAAAQQLSGAEAALQAEHARAPERDAAQREVLRLEALGEAVTRLAQADTEAGRCAAARLAADKVLAAADARQQTLASQCSALLARIDNLQALAGAAASLELRLQQAEQRARALAALAAARTQLGRHEATAAKARQACDSAMQGASAARAAFATLDMRWRQAQAAILARHLHDGEPCPVCGSANHPAPAVHADELPTEQALQAAAEQARAADSALDAARQARNAAELACAAAAAEVDTRASALAPAGDDEPDRADAEPAQLRHQLDAAHAAATELATLRTQLLAVEHATADVAAAAEQARTQAVSAASAAHAAAQVAEERRAGVPEALRSPVALQAALAEAQARRAQLERVLQQAQAMHDQAARRVAALQAQSATLAESVAAAATRVDEARLQFAEALVTAGFAAEGGGESGGEAAWRVALLPAERIAALDAAIREAEQRHAAARERAERALSAIAGLARPDLDALEVRAAAARAAVEAVLDRIAQARGALSALADTLARLDLIARESGAIEAEYRIVGHLADIANGNNGRNLTFQRYVLAALLDDVLRAASLRLTAMSRGRYQLQRREDVADARRAAGLDLEVVDEYTGRSRPAATLSGGEGFMASLALALGLSDVVQGYAGGVQLDTLFIDEGFGSLDPESLELAMRALIDLQQRGRMVGVISHVEEMKQQIDVAVDVVQGIRGSRIRVKT